MWRDLELITAEDETVRRREQDMFADEIKAKSEDENIFEKEMNYIKMVTSEVLPSPYPGFTWNQFRIDLKSSFNQASINLVSNLNQVEK